MKAVRSAALAALVSVLVVAAGAQPANDPSEYRIGPKDLLKIGVYEVPELNVTQRVSEDGTISLPFIGEVKVAGYSQQQLTAELKRLLETNYVARATVTVDLAEVRSRPISVLGAVTHPGDLGFTGQWTLLEALTAAGGLAEGHGDAISILRRAPNGLNDQLTISAERLLLRADPKVNVPLYSGDLVSVERMVPANVYFLGEVATPGALQFPDTEPLTLLSAIARAGGLTDRASPKLVIRRKAGGGRDDVAEIEANYRRILAGKEPDVVLADGDIIVVKESFF